MSRQLKPETAVRNRRAANAANRARMELAQRHRAEYEAIQDQVREEMGLPPIVRRGPTPREHLARARALLQPTDRRSA